MTPEELLDLRKTIVPKSDQLNFDDVAHGPIVVTVESVKGTSDEKQPVSIGIGKDRQPYKPCKTMRRVLISAWGDKAVDWIGRSMELFGDPTVKYGGVEVGGIRIGKLSHIDKPLDLMLTATRGKRTPYHVGVLKASGKQPDKAESPAVRFRQWLDSKGIREIDAVEAINGTPIDDATETDWAKLRAWAETAKPKRQQEAPWENDDAAFEAARAAGHG